MRGILLLVTGLSITACTASQSSPGDETNPTVTYRYSGDPYGTRFEETSEEAFYHCAEQFDGKSYLQTVEDSGDENLAIFECI